MSSFPVTYCALLYGDEPVLARRCLGSICKHVQGTETCLRVGMNAVGAATLGYIAELQEAGLLSAQNVFHAHENICKYPMMRRMFYAAPRPITTPYACWFDDDSFILPDATGWAEALLVNMADADMLGSIYTQRLRDKQYLWVREQPWYTGRTVPAKHSVRFVTGGWWCIRTALLQQHNWPTPELLHRGGDVMLGELCRQQRYRLKAFRQDLAVNADAAGRESKAARRGFDSKPIGWDYVSGGAADAHVSEIISRKEPQMAEVTEATPQLERVLVALEDGVRELREKSTAYQQVHAARQPSDAAQAIAAKLSLLVEQPSGEKYTVTLPAVSGPAASEQTAGILDASLSELGREIAASWAHVRSLADTGVRYCEASRGAVSPPAQVPDVAQAGVVPVPTVPAQAPRVVPLP